MILEQVKNNCDLCEAAVEYLSTTKYQPTTLYVSPKNMQIGDKLSKKYGFKLFIDTSLPDDAWYFCGPWSGYFSPGA